MTPGEARAAIAGTLSDMDRSLDRLGSMPWERLNRETADEAASRFRILAKNVGVTLPLTASIEEIGVILDASGLDIITVDVDREMGDAEVLAFSKLVALAVNVAAGLWSAR